jgi:hypothetical protein
MVSTDFVQIARQYLGEPGKKRRLSEDQVLDLLRWIASPDHKSAMVKILERPDRAKTTARSRPGVEDLEKVLAVWGLSQAEAAERIFEVSRQAVGKWLKAGVPDERLEEIAKLGAATDLLLRHLKVSRIPSIVRRPAPARANRSLLDLAAQEGAEAVLLACREMFDFAQANSPGNEHDS